MTSKINCCNNSCNINCSFNVITGKVFIRKQGPVAVGAASLLAVWYAGYNQDDVVLSSYLKYAGGILGIASLGVFVLNLFRHGGPRQDPPQDPEEPPQEPAAEPRQEPPQDPEETPQDPEPEEEYQDALDASFLGTEQNVE